MNPQALSKAISVMAYAGSQPPCSRLARAGASARWKGRRCQTRSAWPFLNEPGGKEMASASAKRRMEELEMTALTERQLKQRAKRAMEHLENIERALDLMLKHYGIEFVEREQPAEPEKIKPRKLNMPAATVKDATATAHADTKRGSGSRTSTEEKRQE